MRAPLAIAVWFTLLRAAVCEKMVRFPDRSTQPTLAPDAISIVASLDQPPGNIAAAPNGDIFFSYHPVGYPAATDCGPDKKSFCGPGKVMRIRDGEVKPYPSPQFASAPGGFETVLGLRVDSHDQLWVLDHGSMGEGTPALFCFDIVTHQLVLKHEFDASVVAKGSMLNDLVVSPDGRFVYISDCSIVAANPGIIVLDAEESKSWRMLEGEPSVQAVKGVAASVNGEPIDFPWEVGVDSIAISDDGNWLYLASIYDRMLHRVATHSLTRLYNTTVTVESFGEKSSSDGIVIHQRNIYLTDFENSAITTIGLDDRKLTTLVQDAALLRWPDGISAQGSDLYVTASAIHELISGKASPPYHILKINLHASQQTKTEL